MSAQRSHVIAITNQKGGVGKTTTTMNLACAFAIAGKRVLVIDSDPHGNLTQGLGVSVQSLAVSLRDLIVDRSVPTESAVIKTQCGIDLIGSNPLLAQAARWMVTQTNAEFRLKQRVTTLREQYDCIVIDSCPGLGPLLNSTLNAADHLIIPVDPGFYGYMGIQELHREIEEIQSGTNPALSILGVLLTLSERTVIAREAYDALVSQFSGLVFQSQIRRCVSLREAPASGQSVFAYAPRSNGSEDYSKLAFEVLGRLEATVQAVASGVTHV
jgi:chromosome partitioning protein